MPQITVIPKQHWNFKAIPKDIDVSRILREAEEAGESVVRMRIRCIDGIKTYLFVLRTSDDAKILSFAFALRGMAGIATKDIKYTPLGFTFDTATDDWTWLVMVKEDVINQALQRIYKQRELLKRRQRVTVECL